MSSVRPDLQAKANKFNIEIHRYDAQTLEVLKGESIL